MEMTLADRKYLIHLNMDAGLDFSAACAAAGLPIGSPDAVVLRSDTEWFRSLPAPLPLETLMKRVLGCLEEWADLDIALSVEGATDAQAEFLRADPGFQARARRILDMLTLADRRRLHSLVESNAERGISTELRCRMAARDSLYSPRTLAVRMDPDIPLPDVVMAPGLAAESLKPGD